MKQNNFHLCDGIVLLSKNVGVTSFQSLTVVKKSLNTNKVGHTGTLDSFAQGLLVVCTGRLTRLAGNITEFDKTYKAVIKFGSETDTLEYTGNVIKETGLPTLEKLKSVLSNYKGALKQKPPAFSAIHVDGKRASDLTRKGIEVDIPLRDIYIYETNLDDYRLNENNQVESCMITFTVSKGTYIRSLARDIGADCGSSAHLIGLFRTRVGKFNIEDAAGLSLLEDFTIDSCLEQVSKYKESPDTSLNQRLSDSDFDFLKKDVVTKMKSMSTEIAQQCGFLTIELNKEVAKDFYNGKPLRSYLFKQKVREYPVNSQIAVFDGENFAGLIHKNQEGYLNYKFVLN